MKPAILFAVPGTSSHDAAAAFRNIDCRAAERFPGVARQWAYTSAGIRAKLAATGRETPDPAAALERLCRTGATHVALHSLHMVPGMEYDELGQTFERTTAFDEISLGAPLLDTAAWLRRTIAILRRNVPEDGGTGHALLLVAHGSRRPEALRSLESAADLCRSLAGHVRLGAVIPPPALCDVAAECREEGVTRVSLLPLTVAAGEASGRDIAGPQPGSWRSGLEAEGIACTPLLKGLGEYDAIVALWLEQIAVMLGEFGYG